MSASSNHRASIARALLLKPDRVIGPQQPDQPSYLRILLAGGEWMDWDVRRDLATRIPEFIEGPTLSRRTLQSLNALLDAINVQRLRTAEAALTAEAESVKIPLWKQVGCQELAKVLVLARAECGDAQACATAAGYAIAEARASIVRGDLGAWFYIRAALWWAYRGRADTFDIEYKPSPRYADLVSEDEPPQAARGGSSPTRAPPRSWWRSRRMSSAAGRACRAGPTCPRAPRGLGSVGPRRPAGRVAAGGSDARRFPEPAAFAGAYKVRTRSRR
ncbi:hypothetical protein ACRAWG_32695 [Methylobacterium sp. P31]